MQQDYIPLGIYRAPNPYLSNALPFVYTNPVPGTGDIKLRADDRIFAIVNRSS